MIILLMLTDLEGNEEGDGHGRVAGQRVAEASRVGLDPVSVGSGGRTRAARAEVIPSHERSHALGHVISGGSAMRDVIAGRCPMCGVVGCDFVVCGEDAAGLLNSHLTGHVVILVNGQVEVRDHSFVVGGCRGLTLRRHACLQPNNHTFEL